MSCSRIERYLSAYVDGELTGAEMLRVRSHLHDCRACRERHEQFVALKRLVSVLPAQEPESEMIERLCAALPTAPGRSRWDAIREGIISPLNAASRWVRGCLDQGRAGWARLGVVPVAIGVLVFAIFVSPFGPGSHEGNQANTFGSAPVVETGATPVIFMPGSMGPMAGPELHVVADASMNQHSARLISSETVVEPPQ